MTPRLAIELDRADRTYLQGERVTGSVAYAAVVRVVLLAAKVKDDDGRDQRILIRSALVWSGSAGGSSASSRISGSDMTTFLPPPEPRSNG